MSVTSNQPAPYAPTKAIINVIDRYRNRGLQTPITRDVLTRTGVSDSLTYRVLQALQTLDLISADGVATKTLEGLRLAPEEEYQNRFQEWIRGTYAEVFSFTDPSTDNLTAIRDAFRSYEPVAQQGRMVGLFTGLCEAAGLIPESQKEARPRTRTAPAKSATPIRRRSTPRDKASKPSRIPSALAGLLDSLPTEDSGWTQTQRDKFLETFSTVLDYCFPIKEKDDKENE